MTVFRPADGVETAEAWMAATQNTKGPSCMALTRQGLATLRTDHTTENLTAKGAYILKGAKADHKVTLFASGSEVEIIMEAANALENEGVGVNVVSVPAMDLFYKQPREYQKSILAGDIRICLLYTSPSPRD